MKCLSSASTHQSAAHVRLLSRRQGKHTDVHKHTCKYAYTHGQHMCTHRTNTFRPPHRHRRDQRILCLLGKGVLLSYWLFRIQTAHVLSGVRFPSDPQNPPHSSVSEHSPIKTTQPQARHPLGSHPGSQATSPPCREAARQERGGAGPWGDGGGVHSPKFLLGQPRRGPSCLMQGPAYFPDLPSAASHRSTPRSSLRSFCSL